MEQQGEQAGGQRAEEAVLCSADTARYWRTGGPRTIEALRIPCCTGAVCEQDQDPQATLQDISALDAYKSPSTNSLYIRCGAGEGQEEDRHF